MESGESSSNERYAVFKDSSWFRQFRNGSNPWMARYVYGLIFLVATLLAWAARDYGRNALTEMETGTSKLDDSRDSWHSGWWFAKIVMWIGFTAITFLLPSVIIQLYGEIAHFGAGVFLLIQLTSIISFIMWLNDCCQPDKNAERCQVYVMLLATTAYVVCLVGIILMYIWYTPEPSCLLNIFFITWTLVLLQLMTSVSLHPKVNAGILTPGLMGLYVVFICWCAIRSEPAGENCIRKAEATDRTDWLTIISFVVAVLAIVIATFSTGIDSQCFQKG
ncbi:hypothetical protein I3760_03G224900 [Carya illinoinensis]|nr:hypothetical protein I3760_03G224900 [Carya illinoinensis]KAG2718542.1 hypothetical protein I3760_03G224900 [Carya illinoinensis]